MSSVHATPDVTAEGEKKRLTFDQYLEQQSPSKLTAHRWLGWLVITAIVLTLGVFIYAIYSSITWQSTGGDNVVIAWMYFFLAGGLAAFLMGLDTVILEATLPPPIGGSNNDYETGTAAVRQGWALIGYGLVVTVLVTIGVAGVRAGRFGVEDWVTIVVGFFVILGLGSAALAILRRIRHSLSGG